MTDNTAQPAKKRILVVEDERYLRELYIEILQTEGYEVDCAADGEEGYQALYNGGYDLVLLDIILPKMDGLKILQKLARETPPKKPNGAIIILSNLGQDTFITEGVALGARGYMIKSDYTPDQIIAEVKNYLAQSAK